MTREVKTTCRGCNFAIMEKDQVGCAFGRIPIFQERGRILSHHTFYEIEGICNLCRSPKWAAKHENPKEQVWHDVSNVYDAIILGTDEVTLRGLVAQTLLPKSINIVRTEKTGTKEFYKSVQAICGSYTNFNIIQMYEELIPPDSINHIVKNLKGNYYTVFFNGDKPPVDLFEQLNNFINVKLNRIGVIYDDQSKGLTIRKTLHDLLCGNSKEQDIVEKIEILSKENNLNLMYRWDEVYAT